VNQYVLAGIAAIVLAAGAFTAGWRVNSWRHDSQQLAIQEAADKAGKAATSAAVTAIEGIQVKYVTIKQQAETVTREVPVYRDCTHDPRGLQAINQALAGGESGSGAAVVPAADPAGRPELRGNNP
jgi:hypothetical protein